MTGKWTNDDTSDDEIAQNKTEMTEHVISTINLTYVACSPSTIPSVTYLTCCQACKTTVTSVRLTNPLNIKLILIRAFINHLNGWELIVISFNFSVVTTVEFWSPFSFHVYKFVLFKPDKNISLKQFNQKQVNTN